MIAVLDTIEVERAVLGGAGPGGTIAMRAALAHPDRIGALILMSVEEID